MLAQSHARKPAPPLAARGMWLRLHGGADAFGSALGDAVVGSIVQAERERGLPDEVKQMSPDQKARVLDLASRGNGKIDLNNPEHLAVIKRASETQTEAGQDFSRAELQSRTGDYLKIAGASDDEIAQVQDFYKKSRAYLPEGRVYVGELSPADSQGLGTPPTGQLPNELKPVLGDVADASAIRLGGVVRQIGEEINSKPAIGWALTALDVAAGPAVYAVRKGLEASPLGDAVNRAKEWLFDKTTSLFVEGGYNSAQSSDGATGVFTVANVAMAGFVGAVKLAGSVRAGSEWRKPAPSLESDPYHPDAVNARSAKAHELYGGFDAPQSAKQLGYDRRIPAQKAPFDSHGQPVFFDGKNYITPDIDGHNVTNGWKKFDRSGNRVGTYDSDLNRIKD